MAALDRDLRSANHAWKRGKDASAKWSFGKRPLYGQHPTRHGFLIHPDSWDSLADPVSATLTTAASGKSRPWTKLSDRGRPHASLHEHSNVNKHSKGTHTTHDGRVRGKGRGREEIGDVSRSVAELLALSPQPGATTTFVTGSGEHFLGQADGEYILGGTGSAPACRPVTLDVFVKQADRDGTERLVEKEYEVVDGNGDTLKGRKARRRNLRKGGSDVSPAMVLGDGDEDVDGFELV